MGKSFQLYALLGIYALIGSFTIYYFDGTADVGDSVMHYLFAKSAPLHHELYFDHWAKPLYVLLASPFAQFGFNGIKVFNLLNTIFTFYFIYKSALALKLNRSIVAVLIAMCSPLYYTHTFSGLTEPLFALFVAIALYLSLNKNFITAAVIVSFLPFVRSEGLIVAGIYLLYFIVLKNWKAIPFLLAGSVVYGLAGSFVYGSVFWVFSKIPYATLNSVYGSGDLLNFVYQLYYVVGAPVYIFLGLGIFYVTSQFFNKSFPLELRILVLLGFLAFFVAHTMFWYLGIFNSMGLKRVLLGVMPYVSILGLCGFNWLVDNLFSKFPGFLNPIKIILLAYLILFPILPNPAAINTKRDLMLTREQQLAIEISQKVNVDRTVSPLFFNHFYLSLILDVDYFDPEKRRELDSNLIQQSQKGTIIIWENMYALQKSGIDQKYFDKHPELVKLYECRGEVHQKEMIWALYQKQ